MNIWVIVVAAGSGARFGAPKQLESIDGQTVLQWSIKAANSINPQGIVVVSSADHQEQLSALDLNNCKVVAGGSTRSASVRAGLKAVPMDADLVLVHDAARPLASPQLFKSVIAALESGADAVMPAIPVVDTIKRVSAQPTNANPSVVLETLNRAELVSVQTPQGFNAAVLRQAHHQSAEATDDCALVEANGGKVVVVPGEFSNLKITVQSDLTVVKALIAND